MANLDYKVLVSELQALAGSHLQKLYELSPGLFRFHFYVSGSGEFPLVVDLNQKRAHLTTRLPDAPPASQLAMQLRKNLEGAKLGKIEQHGLDRLLLLTFQKEPSLTLAVEMFGGGNLIVFDTATKKVVFAYRYEDWKDRVIRKGEEYKPAASVKVDPFLLTANSLAILLRSSPKQLIPALVEKVNIGATYLEEIVARSKISPSLRTSDLSDEQVRDLFVAFIEVVENLNRPRPCLYKEKGILEVSPFSLQRFENLSPVNYSSFSEALDEYYSAPLPEQPSQNDKQLAKLKFALQSQKMSIQQFMQKAADEKEKGDKIYEKFSELDELVNFISEQRKKNTEWPAIEAEAKKKFPILQSLDLENSILHVTL